MGYKLTYYEEATLYGLVGFLLAYVVVGIFFVVEEWRMRRMEDVDSNNRNTNTVPSSILSAEEERSLLGNNNANHNARTTTTEQQQQHQQHHPSASSSHQRSRSWRDRQRRRMGQSQPQAQARDASSSPRGFNSKNTQNSSNSKNKRSTSRYDQRSSSSSNHHASLPSVPSSFRPSNLNPTIDLHPSTSSRPSRANNTNTDIGNIVTQGRTPLSRRDAVRHAATPTRQHPTSPHTQQQPPVHQPQPQPQPQATSTTTTVDPTPSYYSTDAGYGTVLSVHTVPVPNNANANNTYANIAIQPQHVQPAPSSPPAPAAGENIPREANTDTAPIGLGRTFTAMHTATQIALEQYEASLANTTHQQQQQVVHPQPPQQPRPQQRQPDHQQLQAMRSDDSDTTYLKNYL